MLSPGTAHSSVELTGPLVFENPYGVDNTGGRAADYVVDLDTQTLATPELLHPDPHGNDKQVLGGILNNGHSHQSYYEPDEERLVFPQESCEYNCSLGPSSEEALYAIHGLGRLHVQQGQLADALSELEQSAAGYIELHGPIHHDALQNIAHLAKAYYEQGKFQTSEVLLRRTIAGYDELYGSLDRRTLIQIHNLAKSYENQAEFTKAKPRYHRAIDGFEKLGELELMANSQAGLVMVLVEQGLLEEAEPLLLQTLATYELLEKTDGEHCLMFLNNLQIIHLKQDRTDKLEPLLDALRAALDKALEPGRARSHAALRACINLAGTYSRLGRYDEAQSLFTRIEFDQEAVLNSGQENAIHDFAEVGLHYQRQRNWKAAESSLVLVKTACENRCGPDCQIGINVRKTLDKVRSKLNEQGRQMAAISPNLIYAAEDGWLRSHSTVATSSTSGKSGFRSTWAMWVPV